MVLTGSFDQILTFMGFSLGIFPILAVVGVFKLRRLGISSYKMPGFPIIPIIYLIVALSVLILGFFERPTESSIAIGIVLLGVPAFLLFFKKKAR